MKLHAHGVALARGVLVKQVGHDAALIDVVAIDACHPGIDVVVHHIQLQAALRDSDAAVDGNKVTLGDFEACRMTRQA